MSDNVVKVRDEQGHGFDLLQYQDVYVTRVFYDRDVGYSLKEHVDKIRAIPYREGDVLVCSFPKSGTHWINNLVRMLLNTDNNNVDTTSSMTPVFLDVLPEESWTSLPSPRILTTHLNVGRLPLELKARAKLVYIVRNPKDVCLSFHYYYRHCAVESKHTWDSMVKQFLHGPVLSGTYVAYLQDLQKHLTGDLDFKPCVLFFEDLKTDGLGQLRKLQEYLGLHHSDAHLQAVLERCDVSKLRRDVNDGKVNDSLVDKEKKSAVYRKGEIGDWKNHFTVAQSEMFDQSWSEKMANSMFKFKYE